MRRSAGSRVNPKVEVVRTYLELSSRAAFHPARLEDPAVSLERVPRCSVELSRRLYREVGGAYHWVDRLAWTDAELDAYLIQPGFGVWLMRYGGKLAGFFELRTDADKSIEIALFGLLSEFVGRGLGKHMLTCAVDRAWELGATRVWLHTCTLDSRVALPNYLRRGFVPYKQETYEAELACP
ncbi:MAG: GNAT family N-acetyltransferase [Gemmatimonadetes bacterium]|nr:GNAT family N-acetyltransferase [Gemmatimonadota bacterium]